MSCVFSVTGLRVLVHPSQCKWKTVGCRFKYQNICFVAIFIHAIWIKLHWSVFCIQYCIHYVHIFLCVVCLHVSAHKWFLHVGSNVYLMWPGPVVCLGITASALGSSPLKDFIPPADPEDLCRFRLSVGPSQQSCCGSLTQPGMCYSSHVVMGCQKQPWQMLLFSSWSDHVGVTLQTTIIILCSALAKSVLWACGAITQRQEDISFAKIKEIQNSKLHAIWKKLRKQQGRCEHN